MSFSNINDMIASIKRGVPVFTVNSRLSRHISSEFDSVMLSEGSLSWTTPAVEPFMSFLSGLFTENYPAPLLGAARSKALWEKAVSTDATVPRDLLQGVAKTSFDAYSIVKEYRLRLPDDELYLTEEAKAFKRWSSIYEDGLKRLGYADDFAMPEIVSTLIRRGIEVPPEIILAGFDELTPAQRLVIDALKGRGVAVRSWQGYDPEREPGRVTVAPFKDEEAEVIAAARWARKAASPGVRIGFTVPELERYRPLILREFGMELAPGSVLPDGEEKQVYNISLGAPLTEEPLVRSALSILAIGEGKEDISKVSQVLLNPYFAGGDSLVLAGVDLALKEENRLGVSLHDLRTLLKKTPSGGLSRRVDAWIRWLKESRKKGPPGSWAGSFSDLLRKTGWLSGVRLSGVEYQAMKAWNSALERLSSLDDVLGPVTRAEAFLRLKTIASDTIHQGETPETSIEVMGLLESTGLSFDLLWVMGCHEYALPSPPSPNPFIPIYLQKEKGVPHSSGERELEFARSIVRRVIRSAPEIIVSYPESSEDRESGVSPFFRGFDPGPELIIESSRLQDAVMATGATGASGGVEEAPQEKEVPVTADELKDMRGGTLIIKNQSLCPFKAFATHRLHARPVAAPELGLKPEARGSILHTAMKLFWEKVEDSKRLNEMKEAGELSAYIRELTERVVRESEIPPPFSARFLEIERERLASLLTAWVEVELGRGPFRVKKVEIEMDVEVAGLRIKGRVDRVDEVEGGKEVVLDYKTGSSDRDDWLTIRPRDPQLLIYSAGGAFDAVSFARLVPGDCRFLGVARQDGLLPRVKGFEDDSFREKTGAVDWEGLMSFWKAAVEGLAKGFLSGVADVDPVNGPRGDKSACKYCDLPALCRVSEVWSHVEKRADDE